MASAADEAVVELYRRGAYTNVIEDVGDALRPSQSNDRMLTALLTSQTSRRVMG